MTQATLWTMAMFAGGSATFATWRDRRVMQRRDVDKIGWIPWPAILIAAIMGGCICLALALRNG